MCKHFVVRLGSGALALLFAAAVGFADEPKPASEQAKPTETQVSPDQQKINQELQKKREALRKDEQQAREKIREGREKAREENRDNRQDARQEVRDADKREGRQDARQDVRDTRESARETRRDTRDDNRDLRREVRSDTRQRVQSYFRGRTGADLGLNFDNQQAGRLAILNLDPNSLGARIGLRRGDVIMSVNGNGVQSGDDFNQGLAANPSQASTILFQRNGRQFTVQLQPQADDQNRSYSYDARSANEARAYLGVTFDPSYREFAVIREVKEDSPADKIGLKSGDTLTHINGKEVRSLHDALQTLAAMPAGEEFELQYDRPQHQTARVSLADREQHQTKSETHDDKPQNQQAQQD